MAARRSLAKYRSMRDFTKTAEPAGQVARSETGWSFVVQQHAARRMHWDFRLELDGVLLSWAVPKGPSFDPAEKRLAVRTEDHPIEYGGFEGIIPKGEYGGGSVVVWDRGTWEPVGDPRAGEKKGHIEFVLHGEKLTGRWHLVRTSKGDEKQNWMLFKAKDEVADPERDVVQEQPHSVVTGRTVADVAADADRVWDRSGERLDLRVARSGPSPAKVKGAKKAPMPASLEPQLATLVEEAPQGSDWVHEIKLDGYRALIRVEKGKATAWSRNGNDWSRPFAPIVLACASLPCKTAWIDGEVCVVKADGRTDFQALQADLGAGRTDRLVMYAFDLVYLDGYDLRRAPLLERKRLLRDLIEAGPSGPLKYSDHVMGEGPTFFHGACRMALEGIVSKRADAPYTSARTRDWRKVKCVCRDEVLIGGFTAPKGARTAFGALLVGQYDGEGQLRYAGRIGTGFDERTLRDLHAAMKKLEVAKPPFADAVPREHARGAKWVRPELIAAVTYTEMTREGYLRHPVFQGLREDLEPEQVLRRGEGRESGRTRASVARKAKGKAEVAGVAISNPDRPFFGEIGLNKLELALYWEAHAELALPHLTNRPLTLVRCPTGHGKGCFYQKHARVGTPEALKRVPIVEDEKEELYLYVDDVTGLVSLAQMGVLEVHPWGSTVGDLERPDVLVFDLDPDPALPRERVIEAALDVGDRLGNMGLEPFLKTTGGKGYHVVVPIVPELPWDEAKAFCRELCRSVSRDHPGKYVTVATLAKRPGKVFLDWMRNGRGATAVAAWSPRARHGAPIAVPIPWDLLAKVKPDELTIRNVDRWLDTHGDAWEAFEKGRRRITAAMIRSLA
jgi:bifunctional non-homologous end joining protein LigD